MSLTPKAVEAAITCEQYYQFPGTTMTVCCLTVNERVSAVGHADCINPNDFDAEKGRMAARRHAIGEVWSILGTHIKLGGAA